MHRVQNNLFSVVAGQVGWELPRTLTTIGVTFLKPFYIGRSFYREQKKWATMPSGEEWERVIDPIAGQR